jgi:DNA mismatch endonuclease (patch repair protein)
MKGNKRADTQPERALRSELHRRGLRFRKDHFLPIRDARGIRADIVFTRARVAVFVDGCFWHGCPEHGHAPRRNTGYWEPKLERNRKRDRLVTERLAEDGWRVIRLWEHVPIDDAAEIVASSVQARIAPTS